MMFRLKRAVLMLAVVLTACAPSPPDGSPTRSVITGNQRTFYNFNTSAVDWDIYTRPNNAAVFQLHAGTLEGSVIPDRGYIWSLDGQTHSDVLVNVTVQQTAGWISSAYGVVCRADEQGNGYYFLISSDQHFSIGVATTARNELFQLVPWQFNSHIKRGFVPNDLRVVCAGDYLALFINDVFVAEAFDREFTTGQLGLTVGAVRQTAYVQFDNLLLRDAILQ
jgi:hypothetical protein